MKLTEFAVERYFARYEFTAKYMLSSSDCDGFAMSEVLSLASPAEKSLWENLHLGYTETIGSPFLREAIKQHYTTINDDEILVSSPGELNFVLMNVLLNAGDHVVCMSPMYQSLYQIALDLNCHVDFWEPISNDHIWDYDIQELEKLIKPDTKMVIINFPHNPTGFQPSLEDYQKIIEIVKHKNIYLFSDEMYRFLQSDKEKNLPAACDLYENAISLWGTAKTFGLAGLRLGWLCTKNAEVLKKVEAFKDYLSICSSATSEILATIALNNLEYFTSKNIAKIKENLRLFESFQQKHADKFDFYVPQSGSTAFIRLKISESAAEFSERLVRDTGIMILPSETFNYGSQHVRIGFGRSNFREVLQIFGDYLETIPAINSEHE